MLNFLGGVFRWGWFTAGALLGLVGGLQLWINARVARFNDAREAALNSRELWLDRWEQEIRQHHREVLEE